MEAIERRALNEAMRRLAEGDRSAFPVVFDLLWPMLTGFSGRVLRDPHEAEDAAQSALAKVFEHASRFDPGGDAAAWAAAIVANECRATRRRGARARPIDEALMQIPATAPDPEAAFIERDLLSAALEVVGDLRPADIDALRAAWSGTRPPLGGAGYRKRLQRAKERLRAAWRARHGAA